MKVSVVIPTYNEEKYIAACLQSLMEQEEKPDEIIVVNNNSTDNTVAIAKQFPVTIINEKQQGMIHSRNAGFNAAQYDIISRTDADTRVSKDWITRMKKDFTSKTVIAVSGPVHFYEGLPDSVKIADWSHKILFFKLLKQTLHHNCLFGPNMGLRKSAWEKVKDEVCLIDKDVHEDIDLSIHLAPYGKIKFDPKLVVDSSFRKFKRIKPYVEYPYRSLRTIRRHKKTVLEIRGKRFVRKVLPKKLMNQLSTMRSHM